MRLLLPLCLLLASCALAQPAAHLVDQADKLAERHTGDAMNEAIGLYRQAAEAATSDAEAPLKAQAVEQIGVLSLRLGRFQPALESLSEALQLYRAQHNTAKEQVTLNNIGLVQSRLGNQRLAIETETESLKLARQIGDRTEEAVVLANLGLAHHELGDERGAIEQFQQAVPIHHAMRKPELEGADWSNIGAIHYTQGELQPALEAFQHALALRRQAGDRRGEANTIGKLAVLRHALGEDEPALALYRDALKIDREVGDRLEESIVITNIANLYMAQSRYTDAIQQLDRVLAFQEVDGKTRAWANALSYKGVALAALGRTDEAAHAYQDALAAHRTMENRRGEAETLERMAALSLKRAGAAPGENDAREAARIAGEIGEKRTQAEALYQLARCLDALHRNADALAAVDEALRLVETVREGVADYDLRASYFAKVRDQWDLKIRLLVESGNVPAAFEAAESSRARSLYDLIRNRLSTRAATENLAPHAAELQAELDPGTVALEYSLGDGAGYVFVVTRARVEVKRLAGRAVIEAAARRLYNKWSAHQDSPADCAELSRLVLAPIGGAIHGQRLVVIPDGALAYIPFGALTAANGTRLVEEADVTSAVSLSTLKLMRDRTRTRRPAPREIAVFADPVFSADDPRVHPGRGGAAPASSNAELLRSASDVGLANLDRLVSTRREAAAIASRTPEQLRWQSLDFDASRSAVTSPRLADYRIVHFATHGLMNSRDPHLSGLVFSMVDAAGRPQNGFVRADELADLRLGADLVVLSACQTALGKELRGEGLLGLARALMYAGAPRVVASLWKVSDSATTDLMSSFYELLLEQKLSPADALRRAKLRLLHNPLRSAPFYWAGFTLQGDWR